MRRRDLIRHLRANGCDLLREGGKHSVYVNKGLAKVSTILHHKDIKAFLARKVCLDPEIPEPQTMEN